MALGLFGAAPRPRSLSHRQKDAPDKNGGLGDGFLMHERPEPGRSLLAGDAAQIA
jgi:hypothetical protein